ncbi:glucose-1-phosphate cytidylyltransferase [Phaeobacter inhibens]|uniref:glucose-1-phosphate cytidylyltransferase n=1 Tax=Phaeobacter inhibens TaxID=221822 RepID=UPI000C9A7C96|nr:glucose-1-phosphate cytidylyltransferase [Phaeobacter inhibens]AUQ70799.1 glucose-1-phosphate cytidylyltransferase RfbF [Phaeobacter inhibens]
MKAVILAGGLGTRLSEETSLKPKPMVEIGGRPILWHIMKIYTSFGITDFVICLGYKGYVIKEFFANYALQTSDVTIDMSSGSVEVHRAAVEPWRISLIDTGEHTMTGGRLKRISHLIDGTFCMTYGDGVGDINIKELVSFHRSHGLKSTVTAVAPPGRFGLLDLNDTRVAGFVEKPKGEGGRINGGFFVLEPEALDVIDGDADMWEDNPMRRLVSQGQMAAFHHDGFWQPMDTLRDKNNLEQLWNEGRAAWKTWDPRPVKPATGSTLIRPSLSLH